MGAGFPGPRSGNRLRNKLVRNGPRQGGQGKQREGCGWVDDPPPPSTTPGRCESEFARLYQNRHVSSISLCREPGKQPLPVSMVETPADGVRSVSRPSCRAATAGIVPNDGHLAQKRVKSCQTSVAQPADGGNRAKRPSRSPPAPVCVPNDAHAVHRTPSAAEKTVVQRIERRRRVKKQACNAVSRIDFALNAPAGVRLAKLEHKKGFT